MRLHDVFAARTQFASIWSLTVLPRFSALRRFPPEPIKAAPLPAARRCSVSFYPNSRKNTHI